MLFQILYLMFLNILNYIVYIIYIYIYNKLHSIYHILYIVYHFLIYIFLFFKQKGTPPCSSRPSQGIYLSNPFNKSFQLLQLVGSSLPIQCAPMFQGVVILGMVCLGSRTALSLLLIYLSENFVFLTLFQAVPTGQFGRYGLPWQPDSLVSTINLSENFVFLKLFQVVPTGQFGLAHPQCPNAWRGDDCRYVHWDNT